MADHVVVLGSGYAGTGAVKTLESVLDESTTVTWVSDVDHHLVLHESHRCLRTPDVEHHITIPVDEIKQSTTLFRQASVESINVGDRSVEFERGDFGVEYDYLLVAIGTTTATYGIDGLERYAHTLERLEDVLAIHEELAATVEAASEHEPGRVVIGGAGLTGVQVTGEIAAYRDDHSGHLDITLVEGLEEILPGSDPGFRRVVRDKLEQRDVTVETGTLVSAVDEDTVSVESQTNPDSIPYDVLIWAGGITARKPVLTADLERISASNRIRSGPDFRTSNERIFAIGDAAMIEQDEADPVPPDAQAAWQAASVAGRNVARAVEGKNLERWQYSDRGRVISIGPAAVAHDIAGMPVDTFDGIPARLLKKLIAVRWIRSIAGTRRAVRAWSMM